MRHLYQLNGPWLWYCEWQCFKMANEMTLSDSCILSSKPWAVCCNRCNMFNLEIGCKAENVFMLLRLELLFLLFSECQFQQLCDLCYFVCLQMGKKCNMKPQSLEKINTAFQLVYFFVFYWNAYYSCPYKVNNVACRMHSFGMYYIVITVRLELWPSCSYICRAENYGSNSEESVLASRCRGTSWYFWHTVFDILCIGTFFSGKLVVCVFEREHYICLVLCTMLTFLGSEVEIPGKKTFIHSFVFFSETVYQLLEENQRYLSQLTSLLQDATQDMENSVMVWYRGVRQCVCSCMSTGP